MNTQKRELKYTINWKDARQSILHERFKGPKLSFDPQIKDKAASDFSKRVSQGEYEYGRKTAGIFSEFIDSSDEVLEIGPGPGTVTVPLSKMTKKITCIDLSARNISHLEKNLSDNGCRNVDIINTNWLRTDDEKLKDKYSLVFCSHFLWMIPDLEEHLIKMENASKKYCAIVQPAGRGQLVKDVFEKITGQKYGGEFEPDGDYFAYVILRQWGRLLNVSHFSYTSTMTAQEKARSIASFIGRFREVDNDVFEEIKKLVFPHAEDGLFTEKQNVVAMWWDLTA
ncbi:2-polyprenyl-3-methyl-5-hydroxy-6-metoxy-1,4-benzoquinol methylase [Methanomicrobium sp. W14]|uniref:class I SAM-dependent methyltransferase n=1 Tax=Methanomicrobium sp. W14 TaxID=2817839 RepID=UPI001AEAE3C5|nr:methyltransferase domain-containing protein [Methanomicrobium sp. W14]MBP2133724.1 2-polyprenyl-3-methyl-5-hydroxy-6-metoxy-1,4-benzoquinol methylase [Methanomicrobium sp. W14]